MSDSLEYERYVSDQYERYVNDQLEKQACSEREKDAEDHREFERELNELLDGAAYVARGFMGRVEDPGHRMEILRVASNFASTMRKYADVFKVMDHYAKKPEEREEPVKDVWF